MQNFEAQNDQKIHVDSVLSQICTHTYQTAREKLYLQHYVIRFQFNSTDMLIRKFDTGCVAQ
jgi:hypothetical protein